MNEAKKNDAPSAEVAKAMQDALELLARVRREARAEAFEEGVEALEELRWASTSNDLVDGAKALRALAAKERAK